MNSCANTEVLQWGTSHGFSGISLAGLGPDGHHAALQAFEGRAMGWEVTQISAYLFGGVGTFSLSLLPLLLSL